MPVAYSLDCATPALAGRAFLIATGRPADGSNTDRSDSTQALVNPRTHNPTSSGAVHEWIKRRAAQDIGMQSNRE